MVRQCSCDIHVIDLALRYVIEFPIQFLIWHFSVPKNFLVQRVSHIQETLPDMSQVQDIAEDSIDATTLEDKVKQLVYSCKL